MPGERQLLLVEDDPTSAAALRAILRRHGFSVLMAATVAEALALLQQHTPSAVVLDLMLPDGDGIQVLQMLRAKNSPARVAVTTAVGDTARLDAVLSLHPTALLQKPIDVGHLLIAIGPVH